MKTKEMPGYIKEYSDFPENGVSIVTKLKALQMIVWFKLLYLSFK